MGKKLVTNLEDGCKATAGYLFALVGSSAGVVQAVEKRMHQVIEVH